LCGILYFLPVSARVTLRQKFSNASELPTSRAKYVFPVPARAAVCAFEMHLADGRVITSVSKEKELAAQEHMAAIREGKASGLVDWVTDDCLFHHLIVRTGVDACSSVHDFTWCHSRKADSHLEAGFRYGLDGR
jgi:hypothetical protein